MKQGIYLHIPFCRKACHYCDFHFSTSMSNMEILVDAMLQEMKDRVLELQKFPIQTIYLGGGTPSLLSMVLLEKLVFGLNALCDLSMLEEFTIECNPEDISCDFLDKVRFLGINRISLGIQTLDDNALVKLNRNHNSSTSLQALEMIRKYESLQLSIDLIFGMPFENKEIWDKNISLVNNFAIDHVSCYNLTVEDRTVLHKIVENKKIILPEVEWSEYVFSYTSNKLGDHGFHHYEISNYGKEGKMSKHNSSYWKGSPYVGIGPSAHSFDGVKTRRWNVANNNKYIKLIQLKKDFFEKEVLNDNERINEIIMTGCRVRWGIDMQRIESINLSKALDLESALKNGELSQYFDMETSYCVLKNEYRRLADFISSELFLV